MVCSSLIVQAGRTRIGVFAQGRHQLNNFNKTLSVGFGFRTTAAKMMMVDSSAGEKRVEMFDIPKEKVDDGGYIGGGWKKLVFFHYMLKLHTVYICFFSST